MAHGNIDAGGKAAIDKAGQPIIDRIAPRIERKNPAKKDGPMISGAMAQQCGDLGRGNHSAPQEFVHLVGCRDPKARPAPPLARPRPAPQRS